MPPTGTKSALHPVRRPSARRRFVAPKRGIAFGAFLLVNATLFLRPAELLPALAGLPIYEALILIAFVGALSDIRKELRFRALRRQPITLCVVGLLIAVVLSHLSHFYLWGAKASGIEFLKTLIYYSLLLTLVNTPERLRAFLKTVAVCATAMISLCVLDYVGWYELPAIEHVSDRDGVAATGDTIRVLRMRGMGIFRDPNDISMLIVASGALAAYFLTDKSSSLWRFAWAPALGVLVFGLFCTRSRGGLLAAGAAGLILMLSRYGRKAAVAFGILGVCLLSLVAGRQGSIELDEGTGQERIQLWREGMAAIKSSNLLFGIGEGLYSDVAGLVAHNSFVHAYVELGLFGGTLFFGGFFFAILALYRMQRPPVRLLHPELARFHPYLAAVLAGWCTGMLSLSRCYVVPTYLVLGTVAAYVNLAAPYLRPRRLPVQWDRRHAVCMLGGSAALFVSINVFVALFAR